MQAQPRDAFSQWGIDEHVLRPNGGERLRRDPDPWVEEMWDKGIPVMSTERLHFMYKKLMRLWRKLQRDPNYKPRNNIKYMNGSIEDFRPKPKDPW